jgi:hypothetical protein
MAVSERKKGINPQICYGKGEYETVNVSSFEDSERNCAKRGGEKDDLDEMLGSHDSS